MEANPMITVTGKSNTLNGEGFAKPCESYLVAHAGTWSQMTCILGQHLAGGMNKYPSTCTYCIQVIQGFVLSINWH